MLYSRDKLTTSFFCLYRNYFFVDLLVLGGPRPDVRLPSLGRQEAERTNMTLEEFLQELERCQNDFYWMLVTDARQVPEARTTPRVRLRATLPGQTDASILDPIGVVCYMRTGTAF